MPQCHLKLCAICLPFSLHRLLSSVVISSEPRAFRVFIFLIEHLILCFLISSSGMCASVSGELRVSNALMFEGSVQMV